MAISILAFNACAQSDEAAQLLLNVEKLAQFKQILSDLKKGYEVVNKGYSTIKDISEGNFNLHQLFLDGLLQVSPEVRKYKRIGEIIDGQIRLVREYKSALGSFKKSSLFTVGEIRYMEQVYGRLISESLRNIDDLTTVITANKLRMSDDERIKAIDRIYAEMADNLSFLRHFNNGNAGLMANRAKEKKDIASSRNIQGLN